MSRAGLPAASWVTPGLCSQSPSVLRLPGHPTRADPRGAAPRYLWAPFPAGWFPGEDPAGASAVPSENVGKGEQRGRGGGSACGDARPVPPALKSRAFAAAQTGVWRGVFLEKAEVGKWQRLVQSAERGSELALRGHPLLAEQKGSREGQASFARRWSDGTESIFPQASAGEGGEKGNRVRRMGRNPCGRLMRHQRSWKGKAGNRIEIY